MAKILQFSPKTNHKFGFERAKKRKKKSKRNIGQLDLFANRKGKILQFPRNLSLFEEALLLDEQGHEKAFEYYWKAISTGDFVADAYCNLGILESKKNNFSKAFDSFTKSLKHDPRHFESHYNLANLYFDLENFNLAKMHYELALEIKSDFPNLYFNLGLVHAILEEYSESINSLLKYKDLVPKEEGYKENELLSNLKWINTSN